MLIEPDRDSTVKRLLCYFEGRRIGTLNCDESGDLKVGQIDVPHDVASWRVYQEERNPHECLFVLDPSGMATHRNF